MHPIHHRSINLTKHDFGNIPVAITGISLGFITLGNLWGDFGALWIRAFANFFAATAVTLMLIKICLHPKKSFDEMQHCLIGSFYPTIAMTLMVFSGFIARTFGKPFGQAVWLFAIVLFIILAGLFILAQTQNFHWKHVVPSWFIPTVGIGVAAVSSPAVETTYVSRSIFYIAFGLYIIMLLAFLYRIATHGKVEDDKRVTLAIIAAPASVCLAGYLATFSSPNPILLSVLVPLALLSTAYVYTLLPQLLKIPFHPGLAPLTFPLAVGSVAIQRFAHYLDSINSIWATFVNQLFYIELFVATLVIGYIVYKLLSLLFYKLSVSKAPIQH